MTTGHLIPMALRAAYLSMHRQTNSRLSRCRMTADQFVLLALLAEQDGITQRELVLRASSDPNTIRAMLVLLARRRLVSRGEHPDDGRARVVTLTPRGRRIHGELMRALRPLQRQLTGLFRDGEAGRLIVYLNRISEEMARADRRRRRLRTGASAARVDR